MKDLFYSPSEKILFWVAGCTDESKKMDDYIKTIQRNGDRFREILKNDSIPIYTDLIVKRSRYCGMRYFYAVKIMECPDQAFSIGEDTGWTMEQWLADSTIEPATKHPKDLSYPEWLDVQRNEDTDAWRDEDIWSKENGFVLSFQAWQSLSR